MARRNRRAHRQQRPSKAPKQRPTLWKRVLPRLWSPLGCFLSTVSFVISVIGLYFLFKTRVLIEPDVPIIGHLAINIPFKVTNDSVLPIYSLTHECKVETLRFSGGGGMDNMGLMGNETVRKLGPWRTVSLAVFAELIAAPKGETVTGGTIEFQVEYSPFLFRWKRESATSKFKSRIADDGKLTWYHWDAEE